LKKFSGRKNFALPVDLPPWSPPHKLEETSQDLSRIRDYYDSSPADWDRPELMKEESFKQPTHNQDEWAKPRESKEEKIFLFSFFSIDDMTDCLTSNVQRATTIQNHLLPPVRFQLPRRPSLQAP
jgi:hypothetical protein